MGVSNAITAKTWAFSTTPEGIVLPEFKKNTNIGVGIGIVLQIVGRVLSNDEMVGNGVYRTLGRGHRFNLGLRPIRKSQGLFTLVWFARTLEYSRPYCTRVLSRQAQRRVATLVQCPRRPQAVRLIHQQSTNALE